ncbi:DNA repair protein RadC [Sinirhodobacter sp. WL0062]|uniref:DNA repair protein RadC n=1 Tax=Rhodobacter flavimaris TaxID=2907145 RepID=A0ABS8Z327_9RHOB|nr:DNA repair protein RadC [Sinirhodobacter sp. WL0062]MCE5975071.1 DNA repair protein RadC [Sinirhodobacter sp. WL0062]
MFDLPSQAQISTRQAGFPPSFLAVSADQDLPFALTTACHVPAALMSGQAHPKVLERFATLADAMQGAIVHAEDIYPEEASRILAILDREGRLVLAGATNAGGVAWCHPVSNAAEARAVVSEASQTRAQAMRMAGRKEYDLARRLRHHADLLDARLVDPLWRVFASRALQIAA